MQLPLFTVLGVSRPRFDPGSTNPEADALQYMLSETVITRLCIRYYLQICQVIDNDGVLFSSTRNDSLSSNDVSSEEDDSTDASWISREDDAILDQYTRAFTILDSQGGFPEMLFEKGKIYRKISSKLLTPR